MGSICEIVLCGNLVAVGFSFSASLLCCFAIEARLALARKGGRCSLCLTVCVISRTLALLRLYTQMEPPGSSSSSSSDSVDTVLYYSHSIHNIILSPSLFLSVSIAIGHRKTYANPATQHCCCCCYCCCAPGKQAECVRLKCDRRCGAGSLCVHRI